MRVIQNFFQLFLSSWKSYSGSQFPILTVPGKDLPELCIINCISALEKDFADQKSEDIIEIIKIKSCTTIKEKRRSGPLQSFVRKFTA